MRMAIMEYIRKSYLMLSYHHVEVEVQSGTTLRKRAMMQHVEMISVTMIDHGPGDTKLSSSVFL